MIFAVKPLDSTQLKTQRISRHILRKASGCVCVCVCVCECVCGDKATVKSSTTSQSDKIAGILRDKTMDNKLIKIPKREDQN